MQDFSHPRSRCFSSWPDGDALAHGHRLRLALGTAALWWMTAFALAPFDAAAGYITATVLGDTTVPDTAWAGASGDLKVRADPADGTVGADRDSLGARGIVVSFNQPVDSLAFTVHLVNEILRPVSWVTFWPRPDTAVLRPTRTRDRLLAGTTYYIRVWQGDPESGRSRLIAQFGFTTRVEPSSGAADTSRVFLLWSFPQDGTLNADADRVVNQGCALYFSGLIDASEVRATLRGLSIGRAASLQVTPRDSTMYLGLAPDDQPLLAKPGHYRIVITGLRDAVGAPVSVPEITFVTQTAGVPANGAHLLDVRPAGLEQGVDVAELNQNGVYLYFSSPIDAARASCRLTSDGEYLVWQVEAV
ncbi:MAG: Ig-like domain-containing protein, partial [Candidatus Latescibacterota bacterium]